MMRDASLKQDIFLSKVRGETKVNCMWLRISKEKRTELRRTSKNIGVATIRRRHLKHYWIIINAFIRSNSYYIPTSKSTIHTYCILYIYTYALYFGCRKLNMSKVTSMICTSGRITCRWWHRWSKMIMVNNVLFTTLVVAINRRYSGNNKNNMDIDTISLTLCLAKNIDRF